MSYSRRFSRTVSVHYSGTVSYPASQTGGSVSYSGTAHELVEVDVHVDTGAFDASVAHCNNSVSGLTASVGAMNAAQCLAIRQNADKISKSIIDGFFSTVRTTCAHRKPNSSRPSMPNCSCCANRRKPCRKSSSKWKRIMPAPAPATRRSSTT